jgi:hypothetical protein
LTARCGQSKSRVARLPGIRIDNSADVHYPQASDYRPRKLPGFSSGIIRLFQRTDDRRLITITKTNRPKTEASSHISIDGIETCFDELTVGQGIVPEVDDLASVDVDSWQDITD